MPQWIKANETRPKEGWYNALYDGIECVLDTNEGCYIVTFPNGSTKIDNDVDVSKLEYHLPESAPKEASMSVEEVVKKHTHTEMRQSGFTQGRLQQSYEFHYLSVHSAQEAVKEYAQQFQQPVPVSIQDRAKRYADEYIGVVGGVSDNKMEDDWETLRAAYTDGAMSMQPATLPVSIIEQLEKANPFESRRTYTTQDMKYNVWVNCVSKLRELLKDQQPPVKDVGVLVDALIKAQELIGKFRIKEKNILTQETWEVIEKALSQYNNSKQS